MTSSLNVYFHGMFHRNDDESLLNSAIALYVVILSVKITADELFIYVSLSLLIRSECVEQTIRNAFKINTNDQT